MIVFCYQFPQETIITLILVSYLVNLNVDHNIQTLTSSAATFGGGSRGGFPAKSSKDTDDATINVNIHSISQVSSWI